ncbi:hypothetical protein Tco_0759414 [Tanacetum coccineum]
MDFEPTFPPINFSRSRLSAQLEPFMTRDQIQQELNQPHTLEQNIQEAIQNAQHVQESLIPPTSITTIQMPSPFYPTSTSTRIPPFRTSLPPSSTFVPLDQSIWIENPLRPQVHTCPRCQRTKTIVNNLQDEMRSASSVRLQSQFCSGNKTAKTGHPELLQFPFIAIICLNLGLTLFYSVLVDFLIGEVLPGFAYEINSQSSLYGKSLSSHKDLPTDLEASFI